MKALDSIIVVERIVDLGFKPVPGTADFVKVWEEGGTKNSIIRIDFHEVLHRTLCGCQVLYTFKTVQQ